MSFIDCRKPLGTVENAVWFLLGVVAIGSVHAASGWWLNSGAGVLRTVLVLLTFGAFAAFQQAGNRWVRALSLWAGATCCTTALLLWTGPGTIWPIVLAAGTSITAAAVFAGALLGATAAKFRS